MRHEFGRQFEGRNVTERATVNAKYLRHCVSTRNRGFCYTTCIVGCKFDRFSRIRNPTAPGVNAGPEAPQNQID